MLRRVDYNSKASLLCSSLWYVFQLFNPYEGPDILNFMVAFLALSLPNFSFSLSLAVRKASVSLNLALSFVIEQVLVLV